MTTDLFFKKTKAVLRGAPRPVPVPVPGAVMVSRDGQSFVTYPSPAAMASSPVVAPVAATHLGQSPISPGPPRPFLEDVPLGSKANAVSTPRFDELSTADEKRSFQPSRSQ